MCSAVGQDLVSTRTAQRWFNHFKNGDLELDDIPRSGRPMEVNVDFLKHLIEQNPRSTLRYLAEQLEYSHGTVEKHLKGLVKTQKYGV